MSGLTDSIFPVVVVHKHSYTFLSFRLWDVHQVHPDI